MQVSELISPNRIACGIDAHSKKRALEKLSELIASDQEQLSSHEVFDSLLARERLGATGLGYGVAIPHGRLGDNPKTLAAFVKLAHGVDFGAADNQPVDLLFALLVPRESTNEHLEVLAALAKLFNDEKFRQELRDAGSREEIYDVLERWSKKSG
ncbi:MAG TPA: PTS IIA-like nitrogen-regulatory protein PtsN [Gammaproteobacteria bacterium]|nr:PTS IIA-like nitrogen-regulatory protein PtsN [Gammaproteobacteria bacterium]